MVYIFQNTGNFVGGNSAAHSTWEAKFHVYKWNNMSECGGFTTRSTNVFSR